MPRLGYGFTVAKFPGRNPYDAHRVRLKNSQGSVARAGINGNNLGETEAPLLSPDALEKFSKIAFTVFVTRRTDILGRSVIAY